MVGVPAKLWEGINGAGEALSAGLIKLKGDDAAVLGPGAEAEAMSGGAPSPTDLVPDNPAFFCSCNFALILAIASASKSCFSHFENVRKPLLRVGLSPPPDPPCGKGLYADAIRRPGADCESGKALMRSPMFVAIDSRKGRRLGIGDSCAGGAAQRRFLPFIEGES